MDTEVFSLEMADHYIQPDRSGLLISDLPYPLTAIEP